MATPDKHSPLDKRPKIDRGNAGSVEGQVAILTARINELTQSLKEHPKDHNYRRSILRLRSRRRKLLDYLKSKDSDRYIALIEKLGLSRKQPSERTIEPKPGIPSRMPVATTQDELQMHAEELSQPVEAPSTSGHVRPKYCLQIRFASNRNPPLSPKLLTDTVAPLLQAVFELQKTLRLKQRAKPRIASISQSSPIEASLEGVADAYKALREDIIPWRRRHQKELAVLAESELAQDIAKKKAEVTLSEAQTAAQLAEARKALAESKKIEQEVEAARFALNRAKFEFVVEMAEKMLPKGSDIERIELVTRLLPNVETLLFSQAEIRPLTVKSD